MWIDKTEQQRQFHFMLAHNRQVWKWQRLGDAPFFWGQRRKGFARDKVHQFAQTANRVCHSFQRLGLCDVRFGHGFIIWWSSSPARSLRDVSRPYFCSNLRCCRSFAFSILSSSSSVSAFNGGTEEGLPESSNAT